jgi:hypothetical protein
MPFRFFHDLFPEVAEQETRSFMVFPESDSPLPVGEYGFLEMFWDEHRCDCRRVFFFVMSSLRQDVEAVVAWGWEDKAFYKKWMRYGTDRDAAHLKGPILNPGSPATQLAPAIPELVRNVLLQDPDYIERVKRHYKMFRDKIDHPILHRIGKRTKKVKKC